MLIGIVQLQSGPAILDNLALAQDKVREAAGRGARLIVLPEATSQAFDSGRLEVQAQDLDGEFATGLRDTARFAAHVDALDDSLARSLGGAP